MDRDGFQKFLIQAGKSPRTIQGSLDCLATFEAYLGEQGKALHHALPADLNAFAGWSAERGAGVGFLAISDYYEWTGACQDVRWTAHALFASHSFHDYKLKEMLGVRHEHVQALKALGIVTAKDLLDAGSTPQQRAQLAQAAGIPPDCLLEMVKLADLARVGGLKAIRGRLYFDGGYDTLDRIASASAEEIRTRLAEYIQTSGFKGIPPTPKEAGNAVEVARHIGRLVKFE